MISKNVQEMIPKIQQYLASQPIEKAWLFGSCYYTIEPIDLRKAKQKDILVLRPQILNLLETVDFPEE